MKRTHPFLVKLTGLLGSAAIRHWMGTLEYKIAYHDPTVDPVHPQFTGPKIFILWHENILFPIYSRGHCNMAMLLSQHGDADVLFEVSRHLGFAFVRGSTFRGGSAALRELFHKGRTMNLVIAPDGPRGPRRVLAAGAVYVAMKLRLPIVCTGMGYDRPYRLRSWDRFAIPRLFSRARAVVGPQEIIPQGLDREGIERERQRIEQQLNRLTCEAEAWATSGARKSNEMPYMRQAAGTRRTKPHGETSAEGSPAAQLPRRRLAS